MNGAYLHLMLNHLSIIGSLFGLVFLGAAMLRGSRELIVSSLVCLLLVAVASIPVYFSGEPAEDVVKRLPNVSDELIEHHEEAAQVAFTAIECVGALALAGLWLFRTAQPPRWFLVILLVGSLLTVGAMIFTANRGRQIRHSEIASHQGSTAWASSTRL